MIPIWGATGGLGALFGSASFFAPLGDTGAGAANLVLSRGTGTATFTRATSATCWGSTGLLLTVAPGVARSTYTELLGGTYLGYLDEEARTNNVIQNRDFTNVAWVMSNMTPLKDQVGIDGTVNSASRITATAGNATAAQTVTIAAVNRPFSVYVKRLVGTGNIDLAQDGATFTNQTVANDGLWHRVTLVASQLNPALTIRLVTSGNSIAVDYAMLEDSGAAARTFPLSPIATTTVAVTRNRDVLTYPTAGNVSGTTGAAYAEITSALPASVIDATILGTYSGTGGNPIQIISSANTVGVYDGASQAGALLTPRPTPAITKVGTNWSGAASAGFVNGTTGAGSFDGDLNLGANIAVGDNVSTALVSINGTVKNARLWLTAIPTAQMQAATT